VAPRKATPPGRTAQVRKGKVAANKAAHGSPTLPAAMNKTRCLTPTALARGSNATMP
jgi:hypothetical protein